MIVNKDWKPNFYKYEKVRRSGRYNMIMEAEQAIKACGISSREYQPLIIRKERSMIRDLIFIDESWRPYHGLVGGSNARKSIAGYSEAAFGCKNCTRNCGYPERPVLLAVSCRP